MRVSVFCLCFLGVFGALSLAEDCSNEECQREDLTGTNMIQVVDDSEDDLRSAFDVVKFTIAGQTNSQSAFNFLNRYMKMEPRLDTPWGNSMTCDGAPTSFVARNDLVPEGSGKCTIITTPPLSGIGLSSRDLEAADNVTAVALEDDFRDGCTFIGNKSFGLRPGRHDSHEIPISSHIQCCLACQGDPHCLGANFVPGTQAFFDMGFGVHLPSANARMSGSGLDVDVVEAIVSTKLGDMTSFDAWMDNSLGLWTTDLDSFIRRFDSDSVPYLAAEWTTGETHMFSIFVHVEGTQMILELMATRSAELHHREDLLNLEPRLAESFVFHLMEQKVRGVLKEARISRAAADLEAVDDFYTKGMQIPLVMTHDGEDVSVRCYEWSTGNPQICYTKRPASKTKGWFTVEVFGNMMKESARYFGKNPMCVMNRWFDNHYSVTADEFEDQSKLDYIIDYLDEHQDIPIACNPTSGIYYIVDPAGWSVQMPSGLGTRLPKRCGGGARSIGAIVPATFVFCDLGTCDLS